MVEPVEWILRQARIDDDGAPVDIALHAGTIVAIGEQLPHRGQQEWDVAGRVVLPGLVDAHVHLDKSFLELPNQSGNLLEAINVWLAARQGLTRASFMARAERALQQAVSNGTTALRTHVDTLETQDLVALEAILEVREVWRHAVDLQVVALGAPGRSTAHDAVMRTALALGADLVGGAPTLEDDPIHAITTVFALAEASGKPIDLHIDECEDPQANALATLAEQTTAHGMQGRVTAGHCCSLAYMNDLTAGQTIEQVARAQLNIITLPSCNLVLQGRQQQPAPRGITRVGELLAAGITVCAASDNVADPFNPFGAYDLLQIANLNAHVAHMAGAGEIIASLGMVTEQPAHVMGLAAYGIRPGASADFVVVDAPSRRAAVTTIAPRLGVFKRGQLVVRTVIERTWLAGMTR